MGRPMTELEKKYLYPQSKDTVPDSWLEEAEAHRCPKCGNLTGHFAGRIGEPCRCPKEPVKPKNPKLPYIPIPFFNIELSCIGQEYQPSEGMRLSAGFGVMFR